MVKSFDLTCLAAKPLKSRIASTLCVFAIVRMAACSFIGKLWNGLLAFGVSVGFLKLFVYVS